MKTQIAKSWGLGSLPDSKGSYIVCGQDRSGARFIEVVAVGTGFKAFYLDGTEVRQDTNLRHFGPLPGIDRSIAAVARHAQDAATPAVQA